MRPCKGAVASLRRPESATESLKVTALTALDFGLDGLDGLDLLSTGLLLCCQRGEILRRKKQLDIFIIFLSALGDSSCTCCCLCCYLVT